MSKFPFAKNFDSHINNSIPCFDFVDEFIVSYFKYFNFSGCRVLDIGCSSGRLIKKLKSIANNADIVGIDYEESFDCGECKKQDFVTYKDSGFDFIVSAFTNNFIRIPRKDLYRIIFEKMNAGGSFVLFEKTVSECGIEEKINSEILRDFKQKAFTPNEILLKEQSIKNLMVDYTEKSVEQALEDAGFKIIAKPWKALGFSSWIAQKN